jgi:hypothetical protein
MKRYLNSTKMITGEVALMVLNNSLVIPKDTVQLMLSLHTRQKYEESEFVQLYSLTTINEVRRINGLPPVPEPKIEVSEVSQILLED